MNCPRCSAELPDSAQSCPRCGFQVRPASFSYLPAGSPPWPTTVPQHSSYAAGTGTSTIAATRPVQQSANAPVTRSASASRKSTLGIPAMIGLFFISILIGGGATLGILYANGRFSNSNNLPSANHLVLPAPDSTPVPSPTPAAQLPPPASFKTLSSSDVGISLKYPSDWTLNPVQKTTDGSSLLIQPAQTNGMLISVERFSASTSAQITGTNDINSSTLTAIKTGQGIVNFQAITPTMPQRTIGGISWDEQDATFSNTQGDVFHITSVAVQHNHLYYGMFFSAPEIVYDQAIQEYYLPMLNSLKFLS